MYLFWKSRNLNVRNGKEKQTCFAADENFLCQDTSLIPIHMQMPSRFGHDCYKIVCSPLIETQLVRTSKLKITYY